MRRIIFDIETNGLLDECHTIHSLVLIDADTGEMETCSHDLKHVPISSGLHWLKEADVLIGHNILHFDLPAIAKITGDDAWLPTMEDCNEGRIIDTMLVTRLIWPELARTDKESRLKQYPDMPGKMTGSHSLGAWGYRLGEHKGDYDGGWDEWSQEMQDYCEQDVLVNLALFKMIEPMMPHAEALKLEHRFNVFTHALQEGGWKFDSVAAEKLYSLLQTKQDALTASLLELYPVFSETTMKTPAYYTVGGVRYTRKGEALVAIRGTDLRPVDIEQGPMRVKTVAFNPQSRHHRASFLQTQYGWVPEVFTDDGIAKVDETTLNRQRGGVIPDVVIDQLVELLLVGKRLGQVGDGRHAWLKKEKGGRIYPGIISTGCVTGRCSHVSPNVAQVPASRAAYGEDCRSCWTVDEGYKLVGADASGLELRMLAHFMSRWDNGEYGNIILNGDIHTANMEAAGLPDRDTAKTFIYAYLYGAGNQKIGSIVEPNASDRKQQIAGKRLRESFQSKYVAVEMLTDALRKRAGFVATKTKRGVFWKMPHGKQGYIRGIDKRLIPIRSSHSILNTLLQSAGGLLMKEAASILMDTLNGNGWTCGTDKMWSPVGHIHDEMQCQVKAPLANALGEFMVESIQAAGKHFNMRMPIDGEYKVGNNWAETH